ncbi:MAG: hypothetical protein Q8920_06550, partial [Bacillota bacterium]|nr:hypothetical protein [Bacillota bacterium]
KYKDHHIDYIYSSNTSLNIQRSKHYYIVPEYSDIMNSIHRYIVSYLDIDVNCYSGEYRYKSNTPFVLNYTQGDSRTAISGPADSPMLWLNDKSTQVLY